MKKLITFLLSILFVSGTGCGNSGSSGNLEEELSGNSFDLIWTEEDSMDESSGSCSSGTTDTDRSGFSSVSNSTNTDEDSASSSYSSDNESTITFGSSTFTVSGDDNMSGSWDIVDDNTLEVEVDGFTAKVDIEIDGDTLYVYNFYDIDC